LSGPRPRFQFGPFSGPKKLGLILSLPREHQAQPLFRARAPSTAPLTPCGAISPAFCFERWGLTQVGGLAATAASHRRFGPTCFKPLSESLERIYLLLFPAGTNHPPTPFVRPRFLSDRPLPDRLPSWQSHMLPNPNPKCKRNFWPPQPTMCAPCTLSVILLTFWWNLQPNGTAFGDSNYCYGVSDPVGLSIDLQLN